MALTIDIEQPSGVIAGYHAVSVIQCYPDRTGGGKTDVRLDSYLDQAAFDAGKAPISGVPMSFPAVPGPDDTLYAWVDAQIQAASADPASVAAPFATAAEFQNIKPLPPQPAPANQLS